jgi:hypothetical protein
MNTINMTPGSSADANNPPAPNQYIGSSTSGMASTALVTAAEATRDE